MHYIYFNYKPYSKTVIFTLNYFTKNNFYFKIFTFKYVCILTKLREVLFNIYP